MPKVGNTHYAYTAKGKAAAKKKAKQTGKKSYQYAAYSQKPLKFKE